MYPSQAIGRVCPGVDPYLLLTHIAREGGWDKEYAPAHLEALSAHITPQLQELPGYHIFRRESPAAEIWREDGSIYKAHPDGSIRGRAVFDESPPHFPPGHPGIRSGLPPLGPRPSGARGIDRALAIVDPQLGELKALFELASASNLPGERIARPNLTGGELTQPTQQYMQFGAHFDKYWEKHTGYQKLPVTYVGINYNPFLHPLGLEPPHYPEPGACPFSVVSWIGGAGHAEDSPGNSTLGSTLIDSWGFNERAPKIPIPIRGTKGIMLDLEVVQQMMFDRLWQSVDYSQKPPMWNFLREEDRDWLTTLHDQLPQSHSRLVDYGRQGRQTMRGMER